MWRWVTCLEDACQRGDLQAAKQIFDRGVSIELKGGLSYPWCGGTPLHVASRFDQIEIVRELLSRGADVEAVDGLGITPLGTVCSTHSLKDYEILKVLLDHGANVNARDAFDNTPLINAASYDNGQAVEILLARGASVNLADDDGATALHVCGDEGVVNILLDAGADIDSRTYEGYTPLEFACRCPNVSKVKVLLSRGASFTNVDHFKETIFPPSGHLSKEERQILKLLRDFTSNYVMK